MVFDKEKIKQLYIEKISGIISTADDEQLGALLASDEQVQQIWQMLEEESRQIGVPAFMDRLEPETDLLQIKRQLTTIPKHRKILSFKSYAAVAAFFVAAISIFFIWESPKDSYEHPANTITVAPLASTSSAVQLITDDGQSVSLETKSTRDTVMLKGIQLRTAANELLTEPTDSTIRMSTLSVPAKETYRIVLPDGSKVWLNAASKLRFPSRFTGDSRKVYLDGEGYFEVVTDAKNPFIVETDVTNVQVLGTRFNLRAYRQQAAQTALVDGSVRLTAENGSSILLKPGHAASYSQTAGFTTMPFDATETLAWMDGVYYFHHASLMELAEVVTRWYGYSVKFDRDLLAHQAVTGLMEKNNIANFLADLESSTGIQHHLVGNILYLK